MLGWPFMNSSADLISHNFTLHKLISRSDTPRLEGGKKKGTGKGHSSWARAFELPIQEKFMWTSFG
jgi:hypothetical protein